jgi:DNA-binding IclR family transcriptional regulator
LIDGCAAWLECRLVASYPGGDHLVFIGRVEHIERSERPSLVFGGGRYLVAHPHDGASLTSAKGPNIAKLHAIRLATRALAELSESLDVTLGLGVWGNLGPTIVRWEEASQPVSENLRTGFVLPVLSSTTGLAFAAWLPRKITADFIDAESEAGGALGPDLELPQKLAQIRGAGVARLISTDAFTDVYGGAISALSVPVFGPDGAMILALTSIGAPGLLDTSVDGKLVKALQQCGSEISRRLGDAGA